MQTLTIAQFVTQVASTHTIFGVSFVKKGNGELRNMQARMHVTKGVKGVLAPGQRKAEDAAHGVLTVYDMAKVTESNTKGAFRRINLAQLVSVKLQGTAYNWSESKQLLISE